MPAKKKPQSRTARKKTVKKVRKIVRKAVKRPVRRVSEKRVEKKLVGEITHFYNKIGVGVVDLSDSLAVGDKISIEGASTNFTQKVESMQIEHNSVKQAKAGDSVGLKVAEKAREGDKVYKVV